MDYGPFSHHGLPITGVAKQLSSEREHHSPTPKETTIWEVLLYKVRPRISHENQVRE
jgi:hypothetical protein